MGVPAKIEKNLFGRVLPEEKLGVLMEEMNYRDAYEKEHLKCAEYAERIAQLEEEKDYLQFRLDRIHNNSLWKATGSLRKAKFQTATGRTK